MLNFSLNNKWLQYNALGNSGQFENELINDKIKYKIRHICYTLKCQHQPMFHFFSSLHYTNFPWRKKAMSICSCMLIYKWIATNAGSSNWRYGCYCRIYFDSNGRKLHLRRLTYASQIIYWNICHLLVWI